MSKLAINYVIKAVDTASKQERVVHPLSRLFADDTLQVRDKYGNLLFDILVHSVRETGTSMTIRVYETKE